MTTFKISARRTDANAAGGESEILFLARADTEHQALGLVGGVQRVVVDRGQHLDAQAEAMGIGEHDACSL